MGTTLYDCLLEVHLERYYPSFITCGIFKAESLLKLTPRDYGAFGLNTTEERHRLYELINLLRSVFNSPSHATSRPRVEHKRSLSYGGNTKKTTKSSRSSTPPPPPPPPPSPLHATPDSLSNLKTQMTLEQILKQERSNFSFTQESQTPPSNTDTLSTSVAENFNSNFSANVSRSLGNYPVERVTQNSSYNYGVPRIKRRVPASSLCSVRDEKILVCVRKRPLKRKTDMDVVAVKKNNTVIINEMKLAVDLSSYILQHKFFFDVAFDQESSNEEVYQKVGKPLVEWLFEKGQSTIFTYGQTGAGKTFTMMGSEDNPGLYVLAAQDIFSIIKKKTYGDGLHLWLSYYEIYCSQLFDLLNERKRLFAREDGSHRVCIAGLRETKVMDVCILKQILETGRACRSKGSTGANSDSSRSHAILQLEVRNSADGYIGRITFIDLAGNERAADIKDSDKKSRKEGAEINQSLLALKECIRSLDQENRFTPFRQSKLTHILKDSFIGKSKTCMIANITPTRNATECSLNTLRYASRVKELRPEWNNSRMMTKKTIGSKHTRNKHTVSVTAPCILCSSRPIRRRLSVSEPFKTTELTKYRSHIRHINKARSRLNILPDKIAIPVCSAPQSNSRDSLDRSSFDKECKEFLEELSGKKSRVKTSNEYGYEEPIDDFINDLNDLNKSSDCGTSNMKSEQIDDDLPERSHSEVTDSTLENTASTVAQTCNNYDLNMSSEYENSSVRCEVGDNHQIDAEECEVSNSDLTVLSTPESAISFVAQTSNYSDLNKPGEYKNSNIKCEEVDNHQIHLQESKTSNCDLSALLTTESTVSPTVESCNNSNHTGNFGNEIKCERVDTHQIHFEDSESSNNGVTAFLNPPKTVSPKARSRYHSDSHVFSNQLNMSYDCELKRQMSSDFIHFSTEENSECKYWFGNHKDRHKFQPPHHFYIAQNKFELSSITHMKTIFPLPPTLKTKLCNYTNAMKNDYGSELRKDAFGENIVKNVQLVKQTEANCFGDCREDLLHKKINSFVSNENILSDATEQDFQMVSSDDTKANNVNSSPSTDNISCAVINTTKSVITSPINNLTYTFDKPIASSTPTNYLETLLGSKTSLEKELESNSRSDDPESSLFSCGSEKFEDNFLSTGPKTHCVTIESNLDDKNYVNNVCSRRNLNSFKDDRDREGIYTSGVAESKQDLYSKSQMMLKPNSCQLTREFAVDSLQRQSSCAEGDVNNTSSIQSSLPPHRHFNLKVIPATTFSFVLKNNVGLHSQDNYEHTICGKRPNLPSNEQSASDLISHKMDDSCSNKTRYPVLSSASPASDASAITVSEPSAITFSGASAITVSEASTLETGGNSSIQIEKNQNHLIQCHEKQLATLTMLCKQEMKLLLQVKGGQKSFAEFLHKVDQIGTQKLKTITTFQQEILICGDRF